MQGTPQQQMMQGADVAQQAAACTPQECATMVDAVEQAMQHTGDCTPEAPHTRPETAGNLQAWLKTSGMQMPTPAITELQNLIDAAADNRRLRRQLEALREAELELAAREAEDAAVSFSILEGENSDLAAKNTQLQQRIAELEMLAQAAEAAAQATQRISGVSPDPCTPKHQKLKGAALLSGSAVSVQEQATTVLKRAAAARHMSGQYQEEVCAKVLELSAAKRRLAELSSQQQGTRKDESLPQQLLVAERQVQEAAEAAHQANTRLHAALQDKQQLQYELAALRQQLEAQPLAAMQHATLCTKILEAQQQLLQEKHHHQQMTGSLLEHAGRLSHKYHNLSDDYDALQHRYHKLVSANEHLSHQLQEAHEVLFELQTAVQVTPAHKQRQQRHLLPRLRDAEKAVAALAQDKQQLHLRLLQAHAFISSLKQRAGTAADDRQQITSLQTPVERLKSVDAPTPCVVARSICQAPSPTSIRLTLLASVEGTVPARPCTDLHAVGHQGHCDSLSGSPAPADAAIASPSPNKGQVCERQPLRRSPSAVHEHSLPALPSLQGAAAMVPAESACSSADSDLEERQSCQVVVDEMQHVEVGQSALQQEITRAKYVLADIAGELCHGSGRDTKQPRHSCDTYSDAGHSNESASVVVGSACSQLATPAHLPPQSSNHGSSDSGSTASRAQSSSAGTKGVKLQQLDKAAAAVRSASAALSGKSYSGTTITAPRPDFAFPDLPCASKSDAAGCYGNKVVTEGSAVSQSTSKHSRYSSSIVDGGLQQPAACDSSRPASCRRAAASTRLLHQSEDAACIDDSSRDLGCKDPSTVHARAQLVSRGAGSCSGKGSISLDQLIADAVSVSLEYDASPGFPDDKALGYSGSGNIPVHDAFTFTTKQDAVTPGSAMSSAGSGPLRPHGRQAWLSQQHKADVTPLTVTGAAAQLEDMHSCVKPLAQGDLTAVSGLRADCRQQQELCTPVNLTPAGLERVASSSEGDAVSAAAAVAQQIAAQLQHQHQHAQVGGCSGGTPAVTLQQQDSAEGGSCDSASSSKCLASNTGAEIATFTRIGNGEVEHAAVLVCSTKLEPTMATAGQQQQRTPGTGMQRATPSKALASAATLPPSPDSALKRAAVTLLSSISPAGVLDACGQAATPAGHPTGSTAADGAGALLSPPQLLQHLTPEWLRSLKRKCQQESQQLQQLRRQMGLATPASQWVIDQLCPEPMSEADDHCQEVEAARRGRDQGPGQQHVDEGQAHLEQSSPRVGSSQDSGMTQQAQPSVDAATAAHVDAVSEAPSSIESSKEVLNIPINGSHSSSEGLMLKPACSGSPLGQLRSHSSVDKLRTHAIMAQAAAAASAATMHCVEQPGTAAATPPVSAAASAVGARAASATPSPASNAGGCVTHFTADAASVEHQMGRDSSSCSLLDYMRKGSCDEHGSFSRTNSWMAATLPPRPDCPTPGSTHSDTPDPLGLTNLAPTASVSSVSPDPLLAELHSSRLVARQLQQQLLQELGKAASLPCMSKVLLKPHTPVPQATTQPSGNATAPAPFLATSPITPGAALNAEAESRLVSPTAQLQLVFEDTQDGDCTPGAAVSSAVAAPECSSVLSLAAELPPPSSLPWRAAEPWTVEARASSSQASGSHWGTHPEGILLHSSLRTQVPQSNGSTDSRPIASSADSGPVESPVAPVDAPLTVTSSAAAGHALDGRSTGMQGGEQHQQVPIALGDSPSIRPQQSAAPPPQYSRGALVSSGNRQTHTCVPAVPCCSLDSASCRSTTTCPLPLMPLGNSPASAAASPEVSSRPSGLSNTAVVNAAVHSEVRQAAPAPATALQAYLSPLNPLVTATAEAAGPHITRPSSGAHLPHQQQQGLAQCTTAAPAAADIAVQAWHEGAPHPQVFEASTVGVAPAASDATWGSCTFATPAAVFNSTGEACTAKTSGSDSQQYFTGLQHSSTKHSVASTAATAKHVMGTPAGLPGLRPEAAHHQHHIQGASTVSQQPALCCEDDTTPADMHTAPAAQGAAEQAPEGSAAPTGTAARQMRLLQRLLASPSEPGSADLSPSSQRESLEAAEDDTADGCVEACIAESAALHVTFACSPTLSELGFVAASASADVARAKQLQQQQQDDMRSRRDGLDGLSFEQRLNLLCADDCDDGNTAQSHDGESLPARSADLVMPDARGVSTADVSTGSHARRRPGATDTKGAPLCESVDGSVSDTNTACTETGAAEELHVGEARALAEVEVAIAHGMATLTATCATQTSPLAINLGTQMYKEASVQVPTPASHLVGTQSRSNQEASSSRANDAAKVAGVHGSAPCDLLASPAKGRDQH